MKTKILTVEDVFSIPGRGLIVCGRKTDEFTDFRIGSLIEIQTSEESFLPAEIRGLELICRRPYDDKIICFLVGSEIRKSDVSNGAEIWLVYNNG